MISARELTGGRHVAALNGGSSPPQTEHAGYEYSQQQEKSGISEHRQAAAALERHGKAIREESDQGVAAEQEVAAHQGARPQEEVGQQADRQPEQRHVV